ncbi:MAG: Hsp20/alpha crystallin family protein [Lentisphaeria bacterium]|nr:Hsp20/alpha crystallin family protein [Lentisphaeria bacterium]
MTFDLGDEEPGAEFFTTDLFRDPAVDRMVRHHRRMMRMMDGFFPEFDLSPFCGAAVQAPFSPRCDLKEKKGVYELTMEVPGLTQKELKITVERNILTISGEKKEVKTDREASSRVVERSYGAFRRSFTLPSGTDIDKITASCRDGVLTVLIPKREESKPAVKTIPVNP